MCLRGPVQLDYILRIDTTLQTGYSIIGPIRLSLPDVKKMLQIRDLPSRADHQESLYRTTMHSLWLLLEFSRDC